MGLIKAVLSGVGSTFADTWKEFFCCDAMPADVLVAKGYKRTGKKSSNTKGSDNIITNGSTIVVNEGQCMLIVDQGQIVEICALPGEYTYDMSTEPSIFEGGLSGIKDTFKAIGKRIQYGGDVNHDQRIYYINIKEITDNKFGTPTPVPFRVNYKDIGRSFTVGLRCNGVYSYRIADPLVFFTKVCGNVTASYGRSSIDNMLHSEFLAHLSDAFAQLSDTVRYDELPRNNLAVTDTMKAIFKTEWLENRGIEIESVAIRSVSVSKEDEDRIKSFEDAAWMKDPLNAAASSIQSQNAAMLAAANNQNGAAMGMFGVNMAQQMGGMNAQSLYNMAAQQQAAPAQDGWKCSCGTTNTGKFCANCGGAKPVSSDSWKCSCGSENTGKFCANCGKPKPAENGWSCSCGAVNKGKFCANCGKPKPIGAPLFKCDKCGWEPADPMNPPKFCAECGDPFGDEDIVK